DWLGWAACGLFALAVLSFVMILAREIRGLWRLKAIADTRKDADSALAASNVKAARRVTAAMREVFKERPELAAKLRALKRHDQDILSAAQIFALHERELLVPLDGEARAAVGGAARRVSAVTSISPAPIAVAFVAFENFRLLRQLAAIYGGRPGVLSV